MRLIDADDFMERVNKAAQIMDIDSIPVPYIRQCVAEMLTIGIESLVEHGKWGKEGCGIRICSICNFEYDHSGMPAEGLNYCPNCGAKMDLEG